MRWIVSPVPHGVYSAEVAERFHKEVIPDTFVTDTIHYIYVNLSKKAKLAKIVVCVRYVLTHLTHLIQNGGLPLICVTVL